MYLCLVIVICALYIVPIMAAFSYDDIKIYYEVQGSGKPLLLLHGWELGNPPPGGQSLDDLRDQLSKDFKVLSPDLPGFGSSERPRDVWGVEQYARCILALADIEGFSRFVLCGYSFGGQVAVKIASIAPERVSQLVIIAGALIRHAPSLRARLFMLGARFAKLVLSFPLIPPDAREFFRHYAKKGFKMDYLELTGIMRDVFRKVIRQNLHDEMPKLYMPTLLLWGELDTIVPLFDGKEMDRLIPNSKLIVYPKIGHQLPKARAREVASEILKFVDIDRNL